jgi:hypothetical protein
VIVFLTVLYRRENIQDAQSTAHASLRIAPRKRWLIIRRRNRFRTAKENGML